MPALRIPLPSEYNTWNNYAFLILFVFCATSTASILGQWFVYIWCYSRGVGIHGRHFTDWSFWITDCLKYESLFSI
jgi:hypothetical protein